MAFDALLHRIVALNKLFGAAGEALARPAGQTLARTLIMRQLQAEAVSVAELARRLRLTRQSVQRVADVLVDDGLLTYRDNPQHARAKLACLTVAGSAALAVIDAHQRDWSRTLGAIFGTEKLEQVNGLLDEVLHVLQATPQGQQ